MCQYFKGANENISFTTTAKLPEAFAVLMTDVEPAVMFSWPRAFQKDQNLFVDQVIFLPRVGTTISV